ncbi:MAG: phosphatidylglycerophosphatase A [Gammaproteobacteria bacterium]|nr:phosphatidylglycerophosphatase A [Gammaproteobacteria bacterium]
MNHEKSENVRKQALKKFWHSPAYFLAFGFGSGFSKKAPGTCGTVVGIPIYWLLGLAFFIGVRICQRVSEELGVEDYPGIVWDEIVGYLVTMFSLPHTLTWIVLGFALFRLLDILKPQPLRWIDRHIHGGWGIMLDDLLAGLAACAILHALKWGVGV